MKAKPPAKIQKATNPSTRTHWNEMNRKQRREIMRQIQSEDISLEVVHPDAAGIDIGNESHYVAVPPSRDNQLPGNHSEFLHRSMLRGSYRFTATVPKVFAGNRGQSSTSNVNQAEAQPNEYPV